MLWEAGSRRKLGQPFDDCFIRDVGGFASKSTGLREQLPETAAAEQSFFSNLFEYFTECFFNSSSSALVFTIRDSVD